MKKKVTAGFVISGLLLLAWPMLAIVSIAVFDAPERSRWDGDIRYGIFYSILLYPAVWGIALFGAVRAVRRGSTRAGAIATLVPYLWVLLPATLVWAWGHQGPSPWQVETDRILSLHSPQEIGSYARDPNPEVRRTAYLALGKQAGHFAAPDKGVALQLLLDGLHDPVAGIQTQAAFSLGEFGPAAEAAVAPLLAMAPTNAMVIAPLGHIGQGHPALVVPSLLRIANHPDADGLKSLVGAVEAVRALKSFPNQAAEIVRGLSGAASRRGDTAERKAFFAQNYLNAWLDTITSLDPHTEYIDPAILEAPLVAILEGRQASSMPLSGTLAMVGRLSSPTPAELDAVRRVVQTGDTPRIRKQAQQILDAHSRN